MKKFWIALIGSLTIYVLVATLLDPLWFACLSLIILISAFVALLIEHKKLILDLKAEEHYHKLTGRFFDDN